MRGTTTAATSKKQLQIDSSSQRNQFGQSQTSRDSSNTNTFAKTAAERSAHISPSNQKSSVGSKFQPILKAAKEDSQTRSTTTTVSGQQQTRSKISTQVESKKNLTVHSGKVMKETTFNYEEKSASKLSNNDTTPNNLFKRKSPYMMIERDESNSNLMRRLDDTDDIIEIKQESHNPMHSDISELSRIEDRIRPSDEVKYMDLHLQDPNEQSILESFANRPNIRGTTSSFLVVDEALPRGSDFKTFNQDDEHFEVIREEIKDHTQYLHDLDSRQNSDFKRFNIDDEVTHLQSLRIINQHQLPSHIDLITYGSNRFSEHEQLEQLQDTPTNIKERTGSMQENRIMSPQSFGSPDPASKKYQQQFPQSNVEMQQFSNNAHVLSFADQQLQQMEYPPLQAREQIEASMHYQNNGVERAITPTTLMQQQRLNELLRLSNGDMSSLQTSMHHDKLDEKALNNMIDLEKNFVIMQYENILQQLNVEFHKLLSKTKDTEESLVQKENVLMAQSQIIQEKEQTQYQQEQLNRQLQNQVQELLSELEFITIQRQKQQSNEVNEGWRMERDVFEQRIHTLQHKLSMFDSNEADLKDQVENAHARIRHLEQKLRQKDEETFQMSRDNQSLQRDYQSVKEIEQSMKAEIQSINNQRLLLEDAVQELKQNVVNNQLAMRQRDTEIDTVVRENRALKGTLEALQATYNESLMDSQNQREQLTEAERVKMQMKSHIDRQERDMRAMQSEVTKAQQMIEQERQQKRQMEEHYKAEINRMGQSLKEVQSRKQEQYQPYNENYNTSKLVEESYRSNNAKNQLKIDNQKPLQDDIQNYYSPQRNLKHQSQNYQLQEQLSPRVKPDNNSKNSIAWPFLYSAANQVKQQQSQNLNKSSVHSEYDKFKQNVPVRQDDEGSLKRRGAIVNQNESQLHNVLAWDQNSKQSLNHSQSQKPLQRSLERAPQQDKQQFNFLNQPARANDQQRQPTREQAWHQTRSPPPGIQDQAQPAGKKSLTQQSPFRDKNNEQQITHLQNSLSVLQIDKERVENEYRKLGMAKNKNQIEKKKELEFEVEIVNKNIQNIRQKLREMNAF